MDYLTILLIFVTINKVNCQVDAPNDSILIIGQNELNFPCTSSLSPSFIPLWFFNGKQVNFPPSDSSCGSSNNATLFSIIQTSSYTCKLFNPNIMLDHAGNYSCVARDYSKMFIAVVTGPLSCTNNATSISINSSVELKCSAVLSSNGFGFYNFRWTALSSTSAVTSSQKITNDNSNTTSIITTNLNPNNPSKTIPVYTCSFKLAKFNYTISAQTLEINVHYFDYINGLAISGNTYNSIPYGNQLLCKFDSNPAGAMSWQYSNGTLIVSLISNSITFPVIGAASYTCFVNYKDNLAGIYQNSSTVVITNVTNVPSTIKTSSSMPVIVTDNASSKDFKKSEADVENKIKLAIGLSVGLVVFLIILALIVGIFLKKKIVASRNQTNNEYEMTNANLDNHIYADLNKNAIRNNDYENIKI